jgi:hypothetical protein
MENVKIQSGIVTCILGTTNNLPNGKTYTGVTSNQTGAGKYKDSPFATYTAVVTGTGAVTATVNIHGSNDGVYWNTTALGTITLSGTTSAADGFANLGASYKYVRAVLTNLTGTGAACYVLQGV